MSEIVLGVETRKERINPISSLHQITTPAINLKNGGINHNIRNQRAESISTKKSFRKSG